MSTSPASSRQAIILRSFYCEAYEFCEGQCSEQCALCRQEDADEEAMRERLDDDYRADPVNQPENIR